MMMQKSCKGDALLQVIEKKFFGAFSLQKKERDRGSKNENNNKKNMKKQ